MENYNNYSKEKLVEMLEELNRPLHSHDEIAPRLCELLSCENCPVVIFKLDSRSCNDKCIGQSTCAGELHKWIVKGIEKS